MALILSVLEKDGFDAEHPAFVCYVADFNKSIIGYTIAYYTYSTWRGRAMHLEDLYVTPKYRERQMGSRLLKAIAKVCSLKNTCKED